MVLREAWIIPGVVDMPPFVVRAFVMRRWVMLVMVCRVSVRAKVISVTFLRVFLMVSSIVVLVWVAMFLEVIVGLRVVVGMMEGLVGVVMVSHDVLVFVVRNAPEVILMELNLVAETSVYVLIQPVIWALVVIMRGIMVWIMVVIVVIEVPIVMVARMVSRMVVGIISVEVIIELVVSLVGWVTKMVVAIVPLIV